MVTWMIRSMKKDKKYYIDNLTCYVTRVKTNDTCQPLRPGLHPDMMTICRPISPVSGPQIPATLDRRPSRRRSTPSLFLTADTDLHSIHDDAEVLESEVESEQGFATYINPDMRQDIIAVRQWLEDQGSPEPGKPSDLLQCNAKMHIIHYEREDCKLKCKFILVFFYEYLCLYYLCVSRNTTQMHLFQLQDFMV